MQITGETSDGYHTFNELYKHRVALFIALMHAYPAMSWWSRKHHDGTMYDGDWIIAGMDLPNGQITYHMQGTYTQYLQSIRELSLAPQFDGHTPQEVVKRLLALNKSLDANDGV